jgi:cellulose synthase/poly-beta-1,6-N-acetylglucosamine synthase-like glycosyltransferase
MKVSVRVLLRGAVWTINHPEPYKTRDPSVVSCLSRNLGRRPNRTARLTTKLTPANCLSMVSLEELFNVILGASYFITLAGTAMAALAVAIFLFETIAAIALAGTAFAPAPGGRTRGRVGVLIPAHNEEATLAETIAKIQPQLRRGDWLLVVADNCSDRTAAVARGLGADVVVRTDPVNRGKGFALAYGIRHFANDPPKIVVVIDADCSLSDLAVDRLSEACQVTNRPAQALYEMICVPDSRQRTRVREFAWRVKNWVRPLGLSSLGLPCQLMGSGMAFPWEIIAHAHLATGALAEDLKLGLELAAQGHPPLFCPGAVVTSEFPATSEGSRSQQLRWERGHLGLIMAEIPWFLVKAVPSVDLKLLVLALDAAVPPLSLLSLLVLFFLGLGLGAWLMGMGATALVVSLLAFAGLILATMGCWLKAGRDLLPLRSVFLIGANALTKMPFYCRILIQRNSQAWIRTDRRKS